MHKFLRRSTVVLLVAALVGGPLGMAALADGPDTNYATDNAGMMFIDLVFYRPLGLVSTLVGAATFIVSWPLAATHGTAEEGYQKLVVEPARFTFKRHMGEF